MHNEDDTDDDGVCVWLARYKHAHGKLAIAYRDVPLGCHGQETLYNDIPSSKTESDLRPDPFPLRSFLK